MCGITGLLYFNPQRQVDHNTLVAMRQIAAHRGPDDSGLFASVNVGLAFSRLSIIDVAGGHQPMTNEDETAWIVFNGEIYNFLELRAQLIRSGHRFRTRSDTETILAAWEHYGQECVDHLRGMFAFVIWDSRRRVLLGARDRLGIKPFYYYVDAEMFAFASEIKSLLTIPQIVRNVESEALVDYFRQGYVLSSNTLFQGIHKLPAAHRFTVRHNGLVIERYWDIPMEAPREIDAESAIAELEPLLDETVSKHLISDVPLGVFLSGGIDSSSVVSLMRRQGSEDIQTFSVGYEEPESELNYAAILAKHCHTTHHEVLINAEDFRDTLPQMIWHMDEPVADAPAVALYCLSRFAKQAVTVALSGEGADEIFGGYPTYVRMLALDAINRLPFMSFLGRGLARLAPPGKVRRNIAMIGQPLEARYRRSMFFDDSDLLGLLLHESAIDNLGRTLNPIYSRCQHLDSLAQMSYVDLQTWMPNDLLLKADRMTMAHGVELRVPFLDHKLVEFAARLPRNLKVRGTTTKYLLKRFMRPFLPPVILNRPKRGFSIPIKTWFRNQLSGWLRETLLAANSPCRKFLNVKEIMRLLEAHKYRDCSDQLYALLVFDTWHRTFMQSPLAYSGMQRSPHGDRNLRNPGKTGGARF